MSQVRLGVGAWRTEPYFTHTLQVVGWGLGSALQWRNGVVSVTGSLSQAFVRGETVSNCGDLPHRLSRCCC